MADVVTRGRWQRGERRRRMTTMTSEYISYDEASLHCMRAPLRPNPSVTSIIAISISQIELPRTLS
jgi:hypothetical protein